MIDSETFGYPAGINAFAYMFLARMAYCFLPEKKLYWLKAGSVSKIFISSDIVVFAVQVIGGLMLSSQGASQSVLNIGFTIYRVGIGIQELFIVMFLVLTHRLHKRLLELDRSRQLDRSVGWRPFVWTIYVVLILITVSNY
jgi:hypothetical protein